MDFDLSKENIQPLRGGRNPTQLGMALQAQTNPELQIELEKQKEEFENAIRNYEGDDPLDNYYQYISWVEQSYPKHGHEGNLLPLLEHCLGRFESDIRYKDDRRFCKLWIKYFDHQLNPLELYNIMYARGLCIGCAELYKAWAYYHEAAESFQEANNVLERGRKNLAQPYDELETAYQNLLLAVGQYNLHGRDAARHGLLEKRQALTTLQTLKSGRVSNIRVPSSSGAGILPSTVPQNRLNTQIQFYEDLGGAVGGNAVAPESIIVIARRQEALKENTLRPGPWTTVPVKKRVVGPKQGMPFTVHEDGDGSSGPSILDSVPSTCLEDLSSWKPALTMGEPADPKVFPMYPKNRVYIDPNTEYSIEELRSHRYIRKNTNRVNLQHSSLFLKDVSVSHAEPGAQTDMFSLSINKTVANLQNESNVLNLHYSPVPIGLNVWETSPQSPLSQPSLPKVLVYEQSIQEMPPQIAQPRGSAMKTPFKSLNADDLVETGSRGGMDIAATAQPADSAKPMPLFNDDSSSSFEELRSSKMNMNTEELNASCNTHMFNLNCMIVSTPDGKNPTYGIPSSSNDVVHKAKKNLFDAKTDEQKALSIIMEESKSCSRSYQSGASSGKSSTTTNQTKGSTMASIEEHNSYLAQNLMANAALRSSLLGDLMDFNTQDVPPAPAVPMQSSPIESPVRKITRPAVVKPLKVVPSNPFKSSVISQLLDLVSFPGPHTDGYKTVYTNPRLVVKKDPIIIGNEKYVVEKQLGKGTFGTVFKAFDVTNEKNVALKYQKPPNKWEYYICREIQSRLIDHELQDHFMDVSVGYFNDQMSILVSQYMPCGSLLDMANLVKQKTGKPVKQSLCIYFTMEMLNVVQALHDIRIIHADIKPDNFLIMLKPNNTVSLQLIDFGCSIDMTLFPPNTSFTKRVTTEDFVCCEMRDGKPWNYHTDLFCIAATVHVLFFEKYIQMQKKDGSWSITNKFPRYSQIDLWNNVFDTLLNQRNGPADTVKLRADLEKSLSNEFETDMRNLFNLLTNR